MASIARISIPPPMAEGLAPKSIPRMLSSVPKWRLSSSSALVTPIRSRRLGIRAAGTPSQAVEEQQKQDDESMSIDALHRFFDLNIGNWNGSFYVCIDSVSLPLISLRSGALIVGLLIAVWVGMAAIRCQWECIAEREHEARSEFLRRG